jgi:hypothetical protein
MIANETSSSTVDDIYEPFTMNVDKGELEINLDLAKDDQLSLLVTIMTKVKEWVLAATTDDESMAKSFTPMRMTVRGSAGAGKSFFIKCLANTVRAIFGLRGVVKIAAPTGAAAHNVGGETVHRTWAINPHQPSRELGQKTIRRLKQSNKRTLVVLVDERSMLTADVTGAAERNSAMTVHNGSHDSEDWGGIPVVIFIGDDYQLPPPTNREKGAFDTMDTKTTFSQQHLSGTASFGSQIFLDMSRQCMALTSVKRQKTSQTHCKEILQRLRVGTTTEDDADHLLTLHLANYSNKDVQTILTTGTVMHLFATKAPRNEHNYRRLNETSSCSNPVALLKAQWKSTTCQKTSSIIDHFKNPPPNATLLCRGAIVRIVDKNFHPRWGLFNNAIGTVIDIVFKPGDDPNNGDLPLYVAVLFKNYKGPPWWPRNPKVRIFMISNLPNIINKTQIMKNLNPQPLSSRLPPITTGRSHTNGDYSR